MSDQEQNISFVLNFNLKGLDTILSYEVEQKVSERLDKFIAFISEDPAKNISSKFFIFETRNGRLILVSVGNIQGIQFTWKTSQPATSTPAENDNGVNIYLKGRSESWQLNFANPLVSYDFVTDLDAADYESEDFINFSNEDGVHTSIRIDEIIVVEVSAVFVREGEKAYKNANT